MSDRYIISIEGSAIIDTWNHNCVEAIGRNEQSAKNLVKLLNEQHKREHKPIREATNWDKGTQHGIGTRRV